MKNNIIILLLILSSSVVHSQMNMDSLVNELNNSKNYITTTIHRLTKEFKKFESKDHLEIYEVYLDSLGNLSEHVGLAITHFLFDTRGRTTKRIGYNLKGEYYLWDYSPITEIQYRGDSTITHFYNNKYRLKSRNIKVVDSLGRIIEDSNLNNALNSYQKLITQYDDKLNEIKIIRLDSSNNLCPNKNGMSIHVKRIDPHNNSFIIEELFFGRNSELIDADHYGIGSKWLQLKYSHILRRKKDNDEITLYHNSKGEEVYRSSF